LGLFSNVWNDIRVRIFIFKERKYEENLHLKPVDSMIRERNRHLGRGGVFPLLWEGSGVCLNQEGVRIALYAVELKYAQL